MKMKSILDTYSKLYRVTGVYIENKKTFFFAWKWEWKQSKKAIKDIYAEIKINNATIQKTLINNAIRILEVYIYY